MSNSVDAITYNKVFNEANRTFKLEGITQSWQKRVNDSTHIKVYDISGNHIETIHFRNVLLTRDMAVDKDIENILVKAANNLQSYASIKDELVHAVIGKGYTCPESSVDYVSEVSSTPQEIAIPAKIVFSQPWAFLSWQKKTDTDFDTVNMGTHQNPVLSIKFNDNKVFNFQVQPRNIALYQAQLALIDSQHTMNSEGLKVVARTAAMQEAEAKERERKANMLMLMGMFV